MASTRQLLLVALAASALGLLSWSLVPRETVGATSATGPVQRVVSLSPALTELIYAVGGGDKLVGISDFTTYPPEALTLPSCGGQMNPNLELMTSLDPDLIVYQGDHEQVRDFCASQGRTAWSHRLDTLNDVLTIVRKLGELLDRPAAGAAVAEQLQRELAAVRDQAARRPRVKVFVCVGRQADRLGGLTTCGPGSVLDELVALAGGDNVFSDATTLYPQPSLEALTARAPDVILDLQPGQPDTPAQRAAIRAVWQPLSAIPAVQTGRIEPIFGDEVMIPGPRLGGVARRLFEALQGSAAGR